MMNSILGRVSKIVRSNFYKQAADKECEDPYYLERFSCSDSHQHNWSKKELDYYANLEVAPGSSFSSIRASYRKLLKKYHPD